MELLAKFDAVKMTADTRISEADRDFCAAHQTAYETAKASLQELIFFWEDILETQKNLPTVPGFTPVTYLHHRSTLDISSANIKSHIESLHDSFIKNLVYYFNRRYHVSAETYPIMQHLLPEKPEYDSRHKEMLQRYKDSLQTLSLTVGQVVEEIFAQFDGRNLQEQAFYELKKECHRTVWNTYQKTCRYERKKNVLRLTGFFCSYKDRTSSWELPDCMKQILRGIAHHETGDFLLIPQTISCLLGNNDIHSDSIECTDCSKVTQLRFYKNGRVDIRFADETCAMHFQETYLGTVC